MFVVFMNGLLVPTKYYKIRDPGSEDVFIEINWLILPYFHSPRHRVSDRVTVDILRISYNNGGCNVDRYSKIIMAGVDIEIDVPRNKES